MRNSFTETYKHSQTFEAPLNFVYAWCTDFQEDDPKMIGSQNRRHILERTSRRVVWIVEKKDRGTTDPVRAVWLSPPDSWHLECCGDTVETGDYRLTSLSPGRTRLDMTFAITHPSKEEVEETASWAARVTGDWKKYAEHLERDYSLAKK